MVSNHDWRLHGQENYLKGVNLVWRKWVRPKPTWDHDHCEFCWASFSDLGDNLREGYSANDNYNWICEKCFEDFKEMFEWAVLSGT